MFIAQKYNYFSSYRQYTRVFHSFYHNFDFVELTFTRKRKEFYTFLLLFARLIVTLSGHTY